MRPTMLGVVVLLGLAGACRADDQAEKDLATVKAWLAKQHPRKKWQTGPTRLDSEEIRKAYPGARFYSVFSAPPLPPGAPLPDLIKAYREREADFRANYISALVRLNEKGEPSACTATPADLNAGLMKVASDDDAKVAAAAMLSLMHSGRSGPQPVQAGMVQVQKTDKGWTATANRRNSFSGTVQFSGDGKCLSASKNDTTPLPP